jgi:hypothetical protein
VPIHLLGWGVGLDKRSKGVAGAADSAPQSLMQEYLNRSATALWGIVTNGRLLRVLRDSSALAGAAYVEFDLEGIFDGEAFDAFVLLYRVAHVSRFELQGEDAGPASCWLEKWRLEAIDSGARVLDQLRLTVKEAIETLGTGFIQHPDNDALRAALTDRNGKAVTPETLHRALLRIVYRLLFLFVAEDRDVLLDPGASAEARDRYAAYFASARLRRIAARRHGGPHSDQWQALSLVLDGLGREGGLPALGLPALGGIFERNGVDKALNGCALANEHLFKAVRSLSRVRDLKARRIRPVDFRHLGAEELGSVYESLLEYVPKHDPALRTFTLLKLSGNERKTSGSYYTPSSLVDCLLDSALEPVIDDAIKSGRTTEEQERALLALTICDPACGSGHFLVAAARRVAKRLAFVRTGDPEPGNQEVQRALREVVARCIYGVDLNPMAIELAKVSLWLEAMEPGKPLGFLDAHLKVGNALLGTTPKLLAGGLPDDVFKAIEGDEKKWVTALKKRNKAEREAYEVRAELVQDELFDAFGLRSDNAGIAEAAAGITASAGGNLAEVHAQAEDFRKLQRSSAYIDAKQVADAWCAAFVWLKTKDAPAAITTRSLVDIKQGKIAPATAAALAKLIDQHRFFQWHLEFPEVFGVPADTGIGGIDPRAGWTGGFSCVLGNPPWERIKLQEQEFFATRSEEIAAAPNAAARGKLIKSLKADNPELSAEFEAAKRQAEGESHLLRSSGRYPFTGRGDINTYAVFAETDRNLLGPHGRLGVIVPTGIATDATTQYFFRDVVETGALASLYDFENRRALFRDVDSRTKFSLLTLAGREEREASADFAFFLHDPAELEVPLKRFSLTPDEITLINPNTGTCPVFRSRRDAEITLGIYRRVPVLIKEDAPDGNPWGLSFMTMFHMSNDSHLFRSKDQLEREAWRLKGNVFSKGKGRMLPLYQGMMATFFDHRAADVVRSATAGKRQNQPSYISPEGHADPDRCAMPTYWVSERDLPDVQTDWFIGFSDITSQTNERTLVSYPIPYAGVGNKAPLMLLKASSLLKATFLAAVSSFALDFVVRQKIGSTTLNYFYIKQFPIPSPGDFQCSAPWDVGTLMTGWFRDRLIELGYTANDIVGFARDLGDSGAPFRWDEERRRLLRAELDAAFFHLYGVERDDVDYIMETFPIVKRKDVAAFGSYRTKTLILEVYDAMAQAIRTGEPYQTILDPPPGQGPRHPVHADSARCPVP